MAGANESQIVLEVPHSSTATPGQPEESGRDWLLLGLSKEMNDRIEELASRTGDTKADLINKAIGVYKAISDAVTEGKRVGIVGPDQPLEVEFDGL